MIVVDHDGLQIFVNYNHQHHLKKMVADILSFFDIY